MHERGLRVIIVVVQVRAMKIYVAAVEAALMKKERRHVKFQFDALG
jgi:hypothetical protein